MDESSKAELLFKAALALTSSADLGQVSRKLLSFRLCTMKPIKAADLGAPTAGVPAPPALWAHEFSPVPYQGTGAGK